MKKKIKNKNEKNEEKRKKIDLMNVAKVFDLNRSQNESRRSGALEEHTMKIET